MIMMQIWKSINELKIDDTIVIGTQYINDKISITSRKVKVIIKKLNGVCYDDTGLVYFSNSDNKFLVLE